MQPIETIRKQLEKDQLIQRVLKSTVATVLILCFVAALFLPILMIQTATVTPSPTPISCPPGYIEQSGKGSTPTSYWYFCGPAPVPCTKSEVQIGTVTIRFIDMHTRQVLFQIVYPICVGLKHHHGHDFDGDEEGDN